MSIVSLFAGCGGLDLGAIRAGYEIVSVYELDPAACDAYQPITGHAAIQQADLTRFDLATLPDCEGIVGGPPCQDFSLAGQLAGEQGSRNLWPVAVSAVEIKRPAWFLFENVKGLVFLKRNHTYFNNLRARFEQAGYRVEWRVLNAADFGVPQTRERVFLVGRRDEQAWRWPHPTHFKRGGIGFPRWVSWYEALRDWLKTNPEQATMPQWILDKYPDDTLFSLFPSGGYFSAQQAHHEQQHRSINEPAFTIVASNFNRARVMLPEGMYSCGHTNNQIQHRDAMQPAWTVVASPRQFNRILLDSVILRVDKRAKAILQTLPYHDSLSHEMIGNAVPPRLAEAIFKAVRQ